MRPATLWSGSLIWRGAARTCRPSCRVVIWTSIGLNAGLRSRSGSRSLNAEDLAESTFEPLTKIATTLYLLTVKRDGPLVGEVLPRQATSRSVAVSGWSAGVDDECGRGS